MGLLVGCGSASNGDAKAMQALKDRMCACPDQKCVEATATEARNLTADLTAKHAIAATRR